MNRTTFLSCAPAALVACGMATLAQAAQPAKPAQEMVSVPVGHSKLIEPGWPVREVVVANDAIADVRVTSPERILVIGKEVGSTDLTLWGAEDGQHYSAHLMVESDLAALRMSLRQALPDADVELTQSNGLIVITGLLRRAEQADGLHRFMDATGKSYVDMTEVASPQQVQIKVRVAEANRVAIRTLGINAAKTSSDYFFGSTVGGNPNAINIGTPAGSDAGSNIPFNFIESTTVSDTTTLFAGVPSIDFQLFIEALEDNQYIRTLAEPNLVALSGEEASFLAGGEFPIPVPQAGGGGGVTITIEYKEFGVRLNFIPTVLGDGSIRLQVAPEVSDLSEIGAVQVEGFSIPSLLTRRAATTLLMKTGQTFAMAGLLDRSVAARSQKVPGLGSLPILGPLFRSVRYEQGETELLILATVELVEPLDTRLSPLVPGEAHVAPNDWELFAKGELHGTTKLPDREVQWPKRLGLDRLLGPGAWARHDQDRTPVRPVPTRRREPINREENADGAGSGEDR
ncbi:MAG: type II and III secretion system protein family protein [Planctomycetota bacterium]